MDKTGRDRLEWLKRLWRERRPFVVSVIILLVGLPIVIMVANKNDSQPGGSGVDDAINQSQSAVEDGNYEEAYSQLKNQEDKAATKDQKLALYSQLAAAAASAGKQQEAIDYLGLKHGLDPSTHPADAYMLASLYQQLGKGTEALIQYKAALEYYRSLPKNETIDGQIEGVEAVIDELEAGSE